MSKEKLDVLKQAEEIVNDHQKKVIPAAEEIAASYQEIANFAEDFSGIWKKASGENIPTKDIVNHIKIDEEYREYVEKYGYFPMHKDWKGRCTVICEESYDRERTFEGKFATPEEALALVAALETEERERMERHKKRIGEEKYRRFSLAGNGIVTNSYCAYWPDGRGIFKNEKGEIIKLSLKPRGKQSK